MNKKVILVHGYFRNHKDMLDLKKNLEKVGYEVISVNLPLTFKTIEGASDIFNKKMREIIANLKGDEKISLIGHSTGGLIIRLFLSNTDNINKIHRCVLIATPNSGSQLADIASKVSSIFVSVFKTLKSLKQENVANLNLINEDIDIGIIAGNKNNLILGKLLKKESDGRVEIDSARYEEAKDFVIMPYNHKEIHHKFEIAQLAAFFLENGRFK